MKRLAWLCVLLSLFGSTVRAAAPQVPLYREMRDWIVACDNTRRCEAKGFSEQGNDELVLSLSREAGPLGMLQLALRIGRPVEAPPDPAELRLADGSKPFDRDDWEVSPDKADKSVTIRSKNANAAYRLLHAIRNEDKLVLQAPASLTATLKGLNASIQLIDDVQGRLGTPTALTRTGTRPPADIPDAPPLPLLYAGAPAHPLAAAERQKLLIAAHRLSDCPERDNLDRHGDSAAALTATDALVTLGCSHGAYNFESRFYLASRRPPYRFRPLLLPQPFKDASAGPNLTNAGYDAHEQTLSFFSKGRGLADCGERGSWIFDGQRFQLAAYALQRRCGGGTAEFPLLWRSRVERH